MRLSHYLLGCALLGVTGCAGMSPPQIGQVAGTIVGTAAIPGVGAPLGHLIGMLAGMLFQKKVDKVTAKRERIELGKQMSAMPISASDTNAEESEFSIPMRVWVDESWQNGRLVAGHFAQQNIQ